MNEDEPNAPAKAFLRRAIEAIRQNRLEEEATAEAAQEDATGGQPPDAEP